MYKKDKIFIATKNEGKVKDFRKLLPGYEFSTLLDIDYPEIEETGQTFEENALIKAKTISKQFNVIVISDDSGLVCKGLKGDPGVYSARYAGTNNDSDNNKKLLKEIKGKNKDAKFVAVLCIYFPNDEYYFFRGEVEGRIVDEPKGTNGFGYDPLFFVDEYNKTFGQLSIEEKNTISHRKRAIQKLIDSNLL
ncbi:RdgB/HAM1 family non-canonical purine NTP pyrophosphatase [Mycoplasmatota bacterium WC44]